MTKPNLKNLLESTGRTLYVTDEVLTDSPNKIDGVFEMFQIGKYITCDELRAEYEKRNLVPADIETMVAHDGEFDEKKYVATQWKDKNGKGCFAAFGRWFDGVRGVFVYRLDRDWSDDWWFAGVRKSSNLDHSDLSTQTLETLNLEKAITICKENGLTVTKIY